MLYSVKCVLLLKPCIFSSSWHSYYLDLTWVLLPLNLTSLVSFHRSIFGHFGSLNYILQNTFHCCKVSSTPRAHGHRRYLHPKHGQCPVPGSFLPVKRVGWFLQVPLHPTVTCIQKSPKFIFWFSHRQEGAWALGLEDWDLNISPTNYRICDLGNVICLYKYM